MKNSTIYLFVILLLIACKSENPHDHLKGEWVMTSGAFRIIYDGQDSTINANDFLGMCLDHLAFENDSIIKWTQLSTDYDTTVSVKKLKWQNGSTQFEISDETNPKNETIVYESLELTDSLFKVKIDLPKTDDFRNLEEGSNATFTYKRVDLPFEEIEPTCEMYSLVGKWKLLKASRNISGTGNHPIIKGTIKDGYDVYYDLKPDGRLDVFGESPNHSFSAKLGSWDWPGEYNRKQLVLIDRKGKSFPLDFNVEFGMKKIYVIGDIDGTSVGWKFERVN